VTVYIPGVTAAPSAGQTVYLPGHNKTVTVTGVNVYQGPPRNEGSQTWQVVISTTEGPGHEIHVLTETNEPF
jgi:hypothetical protein